jgi:hypothetical protein
LPLPQPLPATLPNERLQVVALTPATLRGGELRMLSPKTCFIAFELVIAVNAWGCFQCRIGELTYAVAMIPS